jgi:hypothetical protein
MRNLRIEGAIKEIDWQLKGWVSRGQRREIRKELRANLSAAAEEVGPEEALRRLGSPPEVAAEYLEAERGRINFRDGVLLVVIVAVASVVVGGTLQAIFRAGFEAARMGKERASVGPLSFEGDPAIGAHSYMGDISWPLFIALLVVAFVLGSRAWRLLHRR